MECLKYNSNVIHFILAGNYYLQPQMLASAT